ncbi:hypothetical protein FP744_10007831 [Trichoderma asperellum]|nr:hypothetical protein LI328DRAFT_164153 [Trichoderma asperelloides]
MNIPTMEVEDGHVDEDCGCSWCLEHPAIARRKNEVVGQGGRVVKSEPQLEYSRGQSLYTGEGESYEDLARRLEREQSVEPEERPDEEEIDETMSELMSQECSLRERINLASANLSNTSLREVVIEQRAMVGTLVQLLEKQHKRTERLAAKVEKVKKRLKKKKKKKKKNKKKNKRY